ncbi:MAG: hypothetical protein KQ78_00823 [Candidatus Izimaplasma bacterium HR2]|nr:MAG: hypothetical protein KQ78_00823 [Candidatus Izimaplasma bacterium HR2]
MMMNNIEKIFYEIAIMSKIDQYGEKLKYFHNFSNLCGIEFHQIVRKLIELNLVEKIMLNTNENTSTAYLRVTEKAQGELYLNAIFSYEQIVSYQREIYSIHEF